MLLRVIISSVFLFSSCRPSVKEEVTNAFPKHVSELPDLKNPTTPQSEVSIYVDDYPSQEEKKLYGFLLKKSSYAMIDSAETVEILKNFPLLKQVSSTDAKNTFLNLQNNFIHFSSGSFQLSSIAEVMVKEAEHADGAVPGSRVDPQIPILHSTSLELPSTPTLLKERQSLWERNAKHTSITSLPPELKSSLEIYYKQASIAYDGPFKGVMFKIQKEYPGVVLIFPDLKDPIRSAIKLQERYSGNISKLRDVVRGSVVFDDLSSSSEGGALVDLMKKSVGGETTHFGLPIKITRVYDRRTEDPKDVLLNAEVDIGNGVAFPIEIQIATKESVILNTFQHLLYRRIQDLQTKILKVPDRFKPAMQSQINTINSQIFKYKTRLQELINNALDKKESRIISSQEFEEILSAL